MENKAIEIVKVLKNAGFEAVFAGGYVRCGVPSILRRFDPAVTSDSVFGSRLCYDDPHNYSPVIVSTNAFARCAAVALISLFMSASVGMK